MEDGIGKKVGSQQVYGLVSKIATNTETRLALITLLGREFQQLPADVLVRLAEHIVEGLDEAAKMTTSSPRRGQGATLDTPLESDVALVLRASPDQSAIGVATDVGRVQLEFDREVAAGTGSATLSGPSGVRVLTDAQYTGQTVSWTIPFVLQDASDYRFTVPLVSCVVSVELAARHSTLRSERCDPTYQYAASPWLSTPVASAFVCMRRRIRT